MGYTIYRRTNPSGIWEVIGWNTLPDQTAYVDGYVTNGTTYY